MVTGGSDEWSKEENRESANRDRDKAGADLRRSLMALAGPRMVSKRGEHLQQVLSDFAPMVPLPASLSVQTSCRAQLDGVRP
jgi:hypothetical protein